jgi:hypothetical protein
MAKGKANKGGGDAPAGGGRLRQAGDAARELMQQPVVSELVAAALTAAAASLANPRVRSEARDEAAELASDTAAIGASVKRALLDAARSLLDRLDDSVPSERTLASSGQDARGTAGREKAGKGRKPK